MAAAAGCLVVLLWADVVVDRPGYELTAIGVEAKYYRKVVVPASPVGDGEQGEVAGLNSSTQALGRTVGPLIGTSLYRVNPRYPYSLSLLMLVGVLLVITLGSGWRKSSFGTSNLG